MIKKINEFLSVEITRTNNRTIISLNKDNDKTILLDLETNNKSIQSDILFDNNYIIVYTRGNLFNRIPLQIETAYDIKNDQLIDVKNNKKLSTDFEAIFITTKGFDIDTILSVINEYDLEFNNEEDIKQFITYLTNDNPQITKDEIINYILSNYPHLSKYRNLTSPIKISEYKKILAETKPNTLFFHKMPQAITLSKESILKKTKIK